MNQMYHRLQALHARMQDGDPTAVAQFRGDFLPLIVRIVRRAISNDCGMTPLSRTIRALAAQLEPAGGADPATGDPERSIGRVACRMCELLLAQLGEVQPPGEVLNRTTFCGDVMALTQTN